MWFVPAYRALTDITSDFKPDIAHFHNTFLRISPAVYYACQRKGVPVVQTLHNYRLAYCNAFLYSDGRICEKCLTEFVLYPSVIHSCLQQSSVKTIILFAILTNHQLLRTWTEQVNKYITLTNFAKQKFMQVGIPASKITVKPNFAHMLAIIHRPTNIDNPVRMNNIVTAVIKCGEPVIFPVYLRTRLTEYDLLDKI